MPNGGSRPANPLLDAGSTPFQPLEFAGRGAADESFAVRYAAARPVLVGLIGSGIQASRTPAMHEREGAEQGLRCIYKHIDLDVLRLGPEA